MALALLSAAGLLLEIALTRTLSVLYFDAFVTLVLAVAVLGIGLGAALAALRPRWRDLARLPTVLTAAGLSAATLVLLTTTLAGGGGRTLLLAAATVPYALIGVALATLFAHYSAHSPRLYLADLGGAGLGALASVPLLDAVGGLGGLTVAALGLTAAGGLLQRGRPTPLTITLVVAVVVGAAAQLLFDRPSIDLARLATPKPIVEQLADGGRVVATRWDAFARTDLVYHPARDGHLVYLDGGAGSVVPDPARPHTWGGDIGGFAFHPDTPESVFVIGPGGGLEVALARAAGVDTIVAAEVNRASVELTRAVTGEAVYAPDVTVIVDEGRSALRRAGRRFDLIFLSQVVTQAAELRGSALTENGLYTVDAFRDYLGRLTADGRIALKLYDELTLTRALTTAVQALRARTGSDAEAARHLLAVLDTRAQPPVPLLLVYRSPLERERAIALARDAERRGLALLFVPGLLSPPPLDGLLEGRLDLDDVIAASAQADIGPTTDARPFFYRFERGIPRSLRPLAAALAATLVLGALLLPLRQRRLPPGPLRWAPVLFALLGAGFLLVEILVLQRVQLFLGHPTLTLSVTLSALLIGAGVGSLLAGRTPASGQPRVGPFVAITESALLASVALLLWTVVWPLVGARFGGSPAAVRASVTVLTVVPLALPLGMPFPLLLRFVGRYGPSEVALGWAVNGVLSVVGSVGALLIAIRWGYGALAAAGQVGYLLVAILAWRLRSTEPSPEALG